MTTSDSTLQYLVVPCSWTKNKLKCPRIEDLHKLHKSLGSLKRDVFKESHYFHVFIKCLDQFKNRINWSILSNINHKPILSRAWSLNHLKKRLIIQLQWVNCVKDILKIRRDLSFSPNFIIQTFLNKKFLLVCKVFQVYH